MPTEVSEEPSVTLQQARADRSALGAAALPAHPRRRSVSRQSWLLRREALVPLVDAAVMVAAVATLAGEWGRAAAVTTLILLGALWTIGRPRQGIVPNFLEDLPPLVVGLGVGALGLALAERLLGKSALVAPDVATLALVTGALATGRAASGVLLGRFHAAGWNTRRVVIVGTGEVSQRLAAKIAARPDLGLRVAGFYEPSPVPEQSGVRPVWYGPGVGLAQVIDRQAIDVVLVGFSRTADLDVLRILRACEDSDAQVYVVPRLFELAYPGAMTSHIDGLMLVDFTPCRPGWIRRAGKRATDVLGALLGLALTSPLLLAVAILIRLDSPGPVFYWQQRVGRDGRPFRMLKFRSMYVDADTHRAEMFRLNDADGPALKLRRDPRVTRVGRWIRRFSIDELPQLWNVLRGEMSLVGPRPLPLDEAAGLDGEASRRLRVRPGMTGLWQVYGRSDLPFAERMRLDLAYARNWSLARDLAIILMTVRALVTGRGAY